MPKRLVRSVAVKAGSITGYAATSAREPDLAGDVIAKASDAWREGGVPSRCYNGADDRSGVEGDWLTC